MCYMDHIYFIFELDLANMKATNESAASRHSKTITLKNTHISKTIPSLTIVVFLVLVRITLADAYMFIYWYCVNQRVRVYLHVCMIIYTVIVHYSGLYT